MLIKGIEVILYEKIKTGKDSLNRDVYSEVPVPVQNVLVGQPTAEEVLDTLNLTGRKAVYTLGIPKGDTHEWANRKVSFWGKMFQTIEEPIQGIENMIPLDWNKQIKVEILNYE